MEQGIERRRYYRLPIQLPATFTILHVPDNAEVAGWSIYKEYEMIVKDISGGGARIGTMISLPVGTRILIKLPFLDAAVTGEVVHKLWMLTSGVRFIGLTDDVQRKIIAFIFKEQQKRKRVEKYHSDNQHN